VGWHPGHVGLLFRLAELLIVVLPLAGALFAAFKAISAATRRRDEQSPDPFATPGDTSAASVGVSGNPAAAWRTITRVLEEHNHTDERWVEYELDAAKLLDFPLMTDMREPLTVAFHKAKVRADLLRPARAEDLLDDRESAARYLAAVEDYVSAFDVAEAEAIRRRRSDFSREGQQRIARAQSLLRVASDPGATSQEREHAYHLAARELDGLIVLPATTRVAIERGIAGELGG